MRFALPKVGINKNYFKRNIRPAPINNFFRELHCSEVANIVPELIL